MAGFAAASSAVVREQRLWNLALLYLAGLASFFLASYGFANWLTSLRSDVPSLAFGWEQHVPFLPWTIVPYWSIDLLYAMSLFVCRTEAELTAHAKRLLAAQIISVAAFLLFPLRFDFERPHPHGFFGWMFGALASFDQSFNQAPSLHVSLATILWARYSQHLSGGRLGLMRVWLIVAGASTLTTYQHHFIDVATGLWVGLFCIAFIPDESPRWLRWTLPDFRRIEIGLMYFVGAAGLITLAIKVGGIAWVLLWPAGALFIVSGIYFAGRPELFREEDGAVTPAVAFLLAPYLAAAWLNSRLWTSKQPASNEIANGVWLGRVPRRNDRKYINSVVDLAAELRIDEEGFSYRSVPMLDLTVPTFEQLNAAVKAIEDLDSQRPTLVCCALGYSCSAAAVAAWLIASGRTKSVDDSIALIRASRPNIVLSRAHRRRLQEWCHVHELCSR